MSLSVDELLQIRDLPDFLRTDHCYNDLQHAMLVILFRHGMKALRAQKMKYANKVIDNVTLYLYIHFLNEEEGMAYKSQLNLIARDELTAHSEMHINFLDYWKTNVLFPHKNGTASSQETLEAISHFYNLIIKHIDETDIPTYGPDAITIEQTRNELARVARTNMPMSPFMPGAFESVKIMASDVANSLDQKLLSPRALAPIADLDLVQNVGAILSGRHGSLRDRFAATTRGDVSADGAGAQIYAH